LLPARLYHVLLNNTTYSRHLAGPDVHTQYLCSYVNLPAIGFSLCFYKSTALNSSSSMMF